MISEGQLVAPLVCVPTRKASPACAWWKG